MLAMSRISIRSITKLATAIVPALPALLVAIAFAADDKCQADICFRQHHGQAK
jgi:hypothetical protein